jgi:hypothetical protein
MRRSASEIIRGLEIRVARLEGKNAGLIKPPKHLVDKITEILTAAFANLLVEEQRRERAKEDSYKSIPLSFDHIYEFEGLIDDLLRTYMLVKKGESTFEELKEVSRGVRLLSEDISNLASMSSSSVGKLDALIEDLEELEEMDSIEESEEIEIFLFKLFNKERVIEGLEKIIKKNNKTSPPLISEDSLRAYERLAKKIGKYKNIQDSLDGTWVVETEDFGTIRLMVIESNKGFGAYRYDREFQEHNIKVLANPDYMPYDMKYLKSIKDFVRHELVHVSQKEMSLKYNVGKAGLPNKKYDKTYTQRHMNKKIEKDLKSQYAREGGDPNMIQVHALDDVEFYSRLLDEVSWFKRDNSGVSRSELNKKVRDWLAQSDFFVSLKRFKKKNWSKAVGLFIEAVQNS